MAVIAPLTLADRALVEEHLAKNPPAISEHTFTNLFIWRETRPIELLQTGDAIAFIERRGETAVILGSPVGDLAPTDLAREVRAATGCPAVAFERLPEIYAQTAVAAGIDAAEDRASFDYVYRRGDLAELAGRRYHAKRNLVAQCLAQNACVYEEIGPGHIAEMRDFMARWCQHRGCREDPGLCGEYLAIKELFLTWEALPVVGAVIRIGGRVEAFTVGEELAPGTAVVHFEKAWPEIKGLYQVTNQWFAKHALGRFAFINREQDLGIEGLRKAKESYFPDHLVRKYATPAPAPALHERRCGDTASNEA